MWRDYVDPKTGHTCTVERFLSHVSISDGCWEWTAWKVDCGYGVITLGPAKAPITRKAHRLAYIMSGNDIPPRNIICHKCNNPCCVRPDHLYHGTDLDNMRDRITHRGRPIGSLNSNAKLTEAQVKEIITTWRKGQTNIMAAKYGVRKQAITRVLSGKTWTHVPRA